MSFLSIFISIYFLNICLHSLLLTSLTNLTSYNFALVSNTFSFIRFRFSKGSYIRCIVTYFLLIYTFNDNSVRLRNFYFDSFWIFQFYWMGESKVKTSLFPCFAALYPVPSISRVFEYPSVTPIIMFSIKVLVSPCNDLCFYFHLVLQLLILRLLFDFHLRAKLLC